LGQFVFYFLRLGTFGFGGPIALAGRMERDLVEQRAWVSRQDYLEGLAFSQLSPGPLAAQLAMYLGWVRGGRFGAALTAIALILPSFLMAVALAAVYRRLGQLAWIQALFYGIGAAVIAIIAQSAYRLIRKTLGKDLVLWLLFGVVAVATVWTGREMVLLFVFSGLFAMSWKNRGRRPSLPLFNLTPPWLFAGLHGTMGASFLGKLGFFFLKAGAFVFGSGLAIVPFLYGGVVKEFHWLSEQQFLDAIAVAMITPGPVVITAAFVGYLVAGLAGGTTAAVAVFAPPFLIVIGAAPYYRKFARNPQIQSFVQGVTAAAVGAIAGAAVILARRAILDVPSALIAAGAFLVLWKIKKLPEPVVIVVAGVIGIVLKTVRL
jgi:chromate transporter